MMTTTPRSFWISGVAAAGSGILVCALVAGLLDQILPTLPKVSLSLAGIPGLLVGLGSGYGVWWVTQVALQSASWADFRKSLLEVLFPFDPADHGGSPRHPAGDPRFWQLAQEIRQTQLRHQKILDRIQQQVKAEIQIWELAQAQLRSEQQQCRVLQEQVQQLQQHLQKLEQEKKLEQALHHKLRQLQLQVTTLRIGLKRRGIRLQQSEDERAQLQQQQQKLKRLLHRTKSENQKLCSQKEQWARQLEQCQQELRTLQEAYRALQNLCEIASDLTSKTTASEMPLPNPLAPPASHCFDPPAAR